MTNWSILARAGKKTKERKRKILGPIRAIVEKEMVPTLEGIQFASRVAERLAQEAGLSWRDFVKVKPSNCAGYTAADVRTLIAAKVPPQADPEEEFEPEQEQEDPGDG